MAKIERLNAIFFIGLIFYLINKSKISFYLKYSGRNMLLCISIELHNV